MSTTVQEKSSNPLVSIIVPVYNAENYLERCLDSLVSQSLQDIEIVCVNDGSTDNSFNILNSYAAKYPCLNVFHQENKGPGAARNTALENARGKYIVFCDADDSFEPDICQECSSLMEKTNVDIIIFNVNIIEVDRIETIRRKSFGRGEHIPIVLPESEGMLNQSDFYRAAVNASIWGYFYTSELIKRFNIRFTNHRAGQDVLFFHSYSLCIKSGYALNKTFYNHYVRKGSVADTAYKNSPWLYRLRLLCKLIFNTILFAFSRKIYLKQLYIFYWMFFYFRSKF